VTRAVAWGEHIARTDLSSSFQRRGKVENPIRVGRLERVKPIPWLVRPWSAARKSNSWGFPDISAWRLCFGIRPWGRKRERGKTPGAPRRLSQLRLAGTYGPERGLNPWRRATMLASFSSEKKRVWKQRQEGNEPGNGIVSAKGKKRWRGNPRGVVVWNKTTAVWREVRP